MSKQYSNERVRCAAELRVQRNLEWPLGFAYSCRRRQRWIGPSGWELLSESFCSVIPLPIAERQNREGRQIVWKDKMIVFGHRPRTRSKTILTPTTRNRDAQTTATTTDCNRVTANLRIVDKWRLQVPEACTAGRPIAARHAGPIPPMPASNATPTSVSQPIS